MTYRVEINDCLSQFHRAHEALIEDKPTNADLGLKLGLKSLVMEHAFNLHYEGDAPFVKNWREVYETITGNVHSHTRWQ